MARRSDIRDKIATIAGHDGHGAIARAAQIIGVSQRSLHRALTDGPSQRMMEKIRQAEDEALREHGGLDYFEELATYRKKIREHIAREKTVDKSGWSVTQRERSAFTTGYIAALADVSNTRDIKGRLMVWMRQFSGASEQSKR